MDAATRVAEVEGIPEEGCAGRFFEVGGGATEEDAVGVWIGGLGVGEDKDVSGLDAFFLDARGGDVHDFAGKFCLKKVR